MVLLIDSRKYLIQHCESRTGEVIHLNFACHMQKRTLLNFRIFRELWLTESPFLRPLFFWCHVLAIFTDLIYVDVDVHVNVDA